MNAFLSAVSYMVIGGLLAALVINTKAKECGPQEVSDQDVFVMVVAWPALLTAAVSIDDNAMVAKKCGKPVAEASPQ